MIANQDYILVANLGTPDAADLVLEMKTPSSDEFVEVNLPTEDIEYTAHNYYNFHIPASLLTETGTYVFRITGYELEFFETRECLPKPLSSSPSPSLCIITGNLRNIAGQAEAFENVEVVIRPLNLPTAIQSTLTLGRSVRTFTDFDGFFSIPAIRGSTILLEIKDAAVRFQAVVPDEETIRVEDLMPA